MAVEQLHLVDTPAEKRFDRVVQLAARLVGAPIGLMSIVDERWVFMKSVYGAKVVGIDLGHPFRDYGFCSHVVATGAPLIVEDARQDARFWSISPVTAEPGLRSYAGVPIRAPGGEIIGALAVLGIEPRAVSESEVSALGDLARLIEAELSPLPYGTTDALTGALNARTFARIGNRLLEFSDRHSEPSVMLRADVAGTGAINRTYGFDVGDRLLAEAAELIGRTVRGSDLVGRIGADEFGVLLIGADASAAQVVIERIVEEARAYNERSGSACTLAFHLGGAVHLPGEPGDVAGLLVTAEPPPSAEPPSAEPDAAAG